MKNHIRRTIVVLAVLAALAAMPMAASAHTVVVTAPGTSHTQVLHAGDTSIPAHANLFGSADVRVDGVANGQLQVGP